MSINLELPTEEGLKRLAPNKTRQDDLDTDAPDSKWNGRKS